MITAVCGIRILGLAFRAQREDGHGSVDPVVREPCDDGIPGSTVGAVDKRVAVAAVFWVKKLPDAGIAGGDIRRDKRGRIALGAGLDRKMGRVRYRGGLCFQMGCDGSQRWKCLLQGMTEALQVRFASLDFDRDTAPAVLDPARQMVCRCQAVDKRAETDPLDGSLYLMTVTSDCQCSPF